MDLDDILRAYEGVMARIRVEHARVRNEAVPRLTELLTRPFTMLPEFMQAAIRELVQTLLERLVDLLSRIELHLMALPLPLRLHLNANAWGDLRIEATEAVGELRWENRPVPNRWKGTAAATYEQVVAGQTAAITQFGQAAQALSTALNWVTLAAALFFVGVLAIIIQVYFVVMGAVLAAASGVGIPAALGALAAAIPLISGQLGVLLTISTDTYTRVQVYLGDMRTKALDMSMFPNGHWPRPDPARYNDATTRDGDPSDWSVTG